MKPHDRPHTSLALDSLSSPFDRRVLLRRAALLGLSAPAASALLAACGGGGGEEAVGTEASQNAAVPQGTLRFRIIGDISSLDPAFFATSSEEQIMASVYEGLVTYDPHAEDFQVVEQLAESFEASDDGLAYTFVLKPGIQFHGGYGEVTAEDVKFSYERLAGLTKPEVDSPYRGDWAALREVQVTDKYSGTIVLENPFPAMLRSTLPVTSGYVLSKKAVEDRGDDYTTRPIGTGPYEFARWDPGQRVQIRRFSDYGTGFVDPTWDELEFLPIAEDSAADLALESGDVHFGPISLQAVNRFTENDAFGVAAHVNLGYTWIGMNILSPKLEDGNVRNAIRSALDVPAMIEAAFEGHWRQATAIIPPEMGLGHWPDAPVYERDVDRAREFMVAAGVESLDLTYTYTEEPGTDSIAQIAQSNLAEIGINVELVREEAGTFYELGERLRDRELFYVGYVTQPDPSWSMVWFVCDQFDEWNWMYWCDEEFDRLHEAALKELDEDERNSMYIEMQRLWDEAANSVWVAWPTYHYAFTTGVQPAITPHGRVLPFAFRPAS